MYQKTVDVISEFVANSWDADAENVNIKIDAAKSEISIIDDGEGMSFDQCQNRYLQVGRNRRKELNKDTSETKGRKIIGRKGIGKFAGFGIASSIRIDTTSKNFKERTIFLLDFDKIMKQDAIGDESKDVEVLDFINDIEKISNSGTNITLIGVKLSNIEIKQLSEDLSRRFIVSQLQDFKITINDEVIPEKFSLDTEYFFPKDLSDEELKRYFPNIINIDNDWAIERFLDSYIIKWRVGFYKDPIDMEELRGISIFANNKMAQKPFFFDIVGGMSGQYALEYMTGQIIMDFIDEQSTDLIATERQRINLQSQLGISIKAWGHDFIKVLSVIWKEKRSQKRRDKLNEKLSPLAERLSKLSSSEQKTLKSVFNKIASFPRLGEQRFIDWCNDIMTVWEGGRLKNLVTQLSEEQNLDETRLLEILSESDILTSLHVAESIKTKLLTVGELNERIQRKDLENSVRDFIYKNPWIIHPKWESFQRERSLFKIIQDLGNKIFKGNVYNGRVDLVMSSGDQLLLIEFMRPGLQIDWDHISRMEQYALDVEDHLRCNTGGNIKALNSSYLVADNVTKSSRITQKIEFLKAQKIYVVSWSQLIANALTQWGEHLDLLKARHPEDSRIKSL